MKKKEKRRYIKNIYVTSIFDINNFVFLILFIKQIVSESVIFTEY